ncbi:MAG: hypothetical protein ACREQA_06140 [Candidatus Binatia bacterium]
MTLKNKIYFIILVLVAQLSFLGPIATERLEPSNSALGQEILLPASVPEKDRLNRVSFLPVIVEGEIVGGVAVYDDPATERPADYLELYNRTGGLLAVSWFDGFGIQRTAVDRGLIEETDELEGVFVLLLEGDSI